MGKDPGTIYRQESAKARHMAGVINSSDKASDGILTKGNKMTASNCIFYDNVIKTFLLEGYPVDKAEKHIKQWIDYDLVWVGYVDTYKLIGFPNGVI